MQLQSVTGTIHYSSSEGGRNLIQNSAVIVNFICNIGERGVVFVWLTGLFSIVSLHN